MGEAELTCPLRDIRGFKGGVRFYSPIRGGKGVYIHSKLALFDDQVAVVGSANFSYRSMVYDGELSAFIHGASAQEMREDLFAHYKMGAPEDWDNHAVAAHPKTVPRSTGVLRLEVAHFDKEIPARKDPRYRVGQPYIHLKSGRPKKLHSIAAHDHAFHPMEPSHGPVRE